jgi:hypothetical protein
MRDALPLLAPPALIELMAACHTTPFLGPGVLIRPTVNEPATPSTPTITHEESCDYCGAATLEWRKCKLICTNCRQINKSCADL